MPPVDPPAPTLDLGLPVLPRCPVTRAEARDLGLDRARLDRAVRAGLVVRVLRGVYAAAAAPHDQRFRVRAAALATGPAHVATGRTAAWVHGADVAGHTVRGLPPAPPVPTHRRAVTGLPQGDVVRLGDLLVTSPLRTVIDLARDDTGPVALAAADRLVSSGALSARELLGALGPHDDRRVRSLLALVDDRAHGSAESTLRLHWHHSPLPTPVPGLTVAVRGGAVRLALALPDHRFAALVAPAGDRSVPLLGPADDTRSAARRLRDAGWWVVVLPETRVLQAEPEVVRQHLEREFHQALLAQVV